jgi:hypothetical protein
MAVSAHKNLKTEAAAASPEQGPRVGSDQIQQKGVRRRAARRTEQILILSIAIICAAVGFPLHFLWVVAVVLMVLLWAYMAADLGGSRRGGGMISDVVTSIADEVQNLTKEIPESAPEAVDADPEEIAQPRPSDGHDGGDAPADSDVAEKDVGDSDSNDDPTKKELYEQARGAGIEGRSSMNKVELQEALDEQPSH